MGQRPGRASPARVDKMPFKYIVGIDWSGAHRDDETNRGLAVAVWNEPNQLAATNDFWCRHRRTRRELERWLTELLRPGNPTSLVGLDFGFGYPRGAAKIVFNVDTWHCLFEQMATLMERYGTARCVATEINKRFGGNGPFRDNSDRANFQFYLANGISYLRLVERFVPQAISQWYIGSGATVGLSSIAGMALLGRLLRRREKGECKFQVFPFENLEADSHVIVEIYPAIYSLPNTVNWQNNHERDAIRAATKLAALANHSSGFILPIIPGVENVKVHAGEEGWIAGVMQAT
jgi:hypothetical protein